MKLDKDNKTYCSLLWKHICLRPDYQQAPCCRYSGKLDSSTKIKNDGVLNLNSIPFTKIRQAMLKGEQIEGCKKCYEEEAVSGQSLRKRSNEMYPLAHHTEETTSFDNIEYLEIFV